MLSTIITTYILSQLNCSNIEFGRMDWVWTNGAAVSLGMNLDKENSIDGILIFNLGITTTGGGGVLNITDTRSGNWLMYSNGNTAVNSIVAPFIYFVKGNALTTASNIACVYGFNYITVRKLSK